MRTDIRAASRRTDCRRPWEYNNNTSNSNNNNNNRHWECHPWHYSNSNRNTNSNNNDNRTNNSNEIKIPPASNPLKSRSIVRRCITSCNSSHPTIRAIPRRADYGQFSKFQIAKFQIEVCTHMTRRGIYTYIHMCIYYAHIYIYIYIYIHTLQRLVLLDTVNRALDKYGQFSKFHVCFCGLDSGDLKFETVRTIKQRICF